tara:strand:+ start:1857 stop:2837 length:981 start_codon:yes stop_codon:yes gene_type:complete
MCAPLPKNISVFLPCYNQAHLVERQLDAVCAQGRYIHEFLLLDDGSDDNTYEIFCRYEDKYPFVRALKNNTNIGVERSCERIFGEITGDFFVSLGADDCVFPGFFKDGLLAFKLFPNAAFSCGEIILKDALTGEKIDTRLGLSDNLTYFSPEEIAEMTRVNRYLFPAGMSCMFRTLAIAEVGNFNPQVKPFGDVFALLSSGFRHGFCYSPLTRIEVSHSPTTWGQVQRNDMEVVKKYARVMGELFLSDKFSDIRPLVARSGLLSHWPGMLSLLAFNPRNWSMLSVPKWATLILREAYCMLPSVVRKRINSFRHQSKTILSHLTARS